MQALQPFNANFMATYGPSGRCRNLGSYPYFYNSRLSHGPASTLRNISPLSPRLNVILLMHSSACATTGNNASRIIHSGRSHSWMQSFGPLTNPRHDARCAFVCVCCLGQVRTSKPDRMSPNVVFGLHYTELWRQFYHLLTDFKDLPIIVLFMAFVPRCGIVVVVLVIVC